MAFFGEKEEQKVVEYTSDDKLAFVLFYVYQHDPEVNDFEELKRLWAELFSNKDDSLTDWYDFVKYFNYANERIN
jgi:hypothetical protein